MNLGELIETMAAFLGVQAIPHFVIGAVAVDVWAGPRTTSDLNLVLVLPRIAVTPLVREINRMGFRVTRPLGRKLSEGRMVKLPLGTTELDIRIARGDQDRAAHARAVEVSIGKNRLWVATPEDIVLYKLASWRRQDQADIERIVKDVHDLDLRYIRRRIPSFAEETGAPIRDRWNEIRVTS